MDKLVSVLGKAVKKEFRDDDDTADQLNRKYTTIMLLVFSIITSTTQYVGSPINCWSPKHFTKNHEKYTNDVCWISDTYYLPFEDYIPRAGEPKERLITYYRWVPIFLLIQAAMFYFPNVIWRELNTKSGLDVSKIIETSGVHQIYDFGSKRDAMMKYMVNHIDRYLGRRQIRAKTSIVKQFFRHTCCVFCGKRFGNYLVVLYMFVKFLYLVNVIGQIFVLNSFLGADYHLFGIDVIRAVAAGKDWTGSARFPRVTMCDFERRVIGNTHRYTVQCVMSVNFFNEKIYLIVWFWIVFLTAYTAMSFLTWIPRILFIKDRADFVKKHLRTNEKVEGDTDKALVRRFVRDYLRQDGIFILRLVNHNVNSLACSDLTCALWDCFRSKPMIEQHDPNPGNL